MRKGPAAFAGWCCLALGLCGVGGADGGMPGTTTCLPAVVERKTFDPEHLPDPPPPLEEGEAAVCVGDSRCDAAFTTETLYNRKAAAGENYEAAVKVSGVTLRVSLRITIWLPKDAPAFLKEHEEGHRQIFERIYATAGKAAQNTARNCSGKICTGTGKTAAEAQKNAQLQAQQLITDDYNTHVCAVWKRVNAIYDDLTGHAVKSGPWNRQPVKVADAIEAAFKQYAAEAAAATQPAATQPKASAGKDSLRTVKPESGN